MTEQAEALQALIRSQREVLEAIDDYLDRWPSSRISHHRDDLAGALRRELVALEAKEQRAAEKAEERAAYAEGRKYDEHTLNMARLKGITPDEFLEMQRVQRAKMARTQELGSIAEQTARAPSVNPTPEQRKH